MPHLEVQMRREDGGLLYSETIKEVMNMAEDDLSIWKISWTDSASNDRVRLVRQGKTWVYEPII
jgi:hypothetical protein